MKKSLGQNFLIDIDTIDNIVAAAEIGNEDLVIEIGPGKGALTRELLKMAKHVIAVEIDRTLIPGLQKTFSYTDKLTIINEDILKINLRKISEENKEEFNNIIIMGNLPYYITTPIIMKALEEGHSADRLIFMIQKEVADRLAASPGGRTFGAISVAVQYRAYVDKLMDVPSEMFKPKPKVDSSVIRLVPRSVPPVKVRDEREYFRVVKAGFSQRRKTLLNTLSTIDGISKDAVKDVLGKLGIDTGRRAETLSLEEFADISNELFKQ